MIIRHIKIENFRGIRNLDWHPQERILCLVGPNDSTKTSILDAVELALLPRSNFQFTDADFHNGDITNSITIEVTVAELPTELIVEPDKYGLYQRGYLLGQAIKDDPDDSCERVLTIRLAVDKALEPTWTVIKESQGEPKRIGWQDRERLGVARMGDDVERHLTWGRGSALSKLTGQNKTTAQTFIEVARSARQVVAESKMEQLTDAASKALESAKHLGAEFQELKPGLDALGLSLGNSVLGLHQANIPLRLWGLGTKRLLALAVQQSGIGRQSILLIDEIEHGLEPHRIRHLLRRLSTGSDGNERPEGQVMFSTHSPTPVITLPIQDVRFVRSIAGQTTVTQVQQSSLEVFQGIARSHSHAFLGRKLLVCEGATEVGLCRGLEEYWATKNSGRHPTHVGFIALDGKGRTVAPGVALELKRIGYDAALIADTDNPIEPNAEVLNADNVSIFLWEGGMSVEERLMTDLPMQAIQQILEAAFEEYGVEPIVSHVSCFANVNLSQAGKSAAGWVSQNLSETAIRSAIGKAAKRGKFSEKQKGWFKNITMGTRLGEIVATTLPGISDKPAGQVLDKVMNWIYA